MTAVFIPAIYKPVCLKDKGTGEIKWVSCRTEGIPNSHISETDYWRWYVYRPMECWKDARRIRNEMGQWWLLQRHLEWGRHDAWMPHKEPRRICWKFRTSIGMWRAFLSYPFGSVFLTVILVLLTLALMLSLFYISCGSPDNIHSTMVKEPLLHLKGLILGSLLMASKTGEESSSAMTVLCTTETGYKVNVQDLVHLEFVSLLSRDVARLSGNICRRVVEKTTKRPWQTDLLRRIYLQRKLDGG